MTLAIEITTILAVFHFSITLATYLTDRYNEVLTPGEFWVKETSSATALEGSTSEEEWEDGFVVENIPDAALVPSEQSYREAFSLTRERVSANALPTELDDLKATAKQFGMKGWNLYKDPDRLRDKIIEYVT